MTALLRSAWGTPRDEAASAPSSAVAAKLQVQLSQGAAAEMGVVTLWDMLAGRVNSRIPGMSDEAARARAPWTAWDPCSKHRSRCVQARGRLAAGQW